LRFRSAFARSGFLFQRCISLTLLGSGLFDARGDAAVKVCDLLRGQAINVRLIVIDLRARHDVRLLEAVSFGFGDQLLNRHRRRDEADGLRLLFQNFRHGLRLRSLHRQILAVLALHVI
jgi:hypothetical protein